MHRLSGLPPQDSSEAFSLFFPLPVISLQPFVAASPHFFVWYNLKLVWVAANGIGLFMDGIASICYNSTTANAMKRAGVKFIGPDGVKFIGPGGVKFIGPVLVIPPIESPGTAPRPRKRVRCRLPKRYICW
jgi:hypothetical protein